MTNYLLFHSQKTSRVYLEAFYQGIQMVKNMLWQNVRTKQAKVFNLDKTVSCRNGLLQSAQSRILGFAHL